MLEDLIQNIKKSIKDEYPQIELPAAMRAEILTVDKDSDRYVRNIFLEDLTAGGGLREYRMEEECYVYSVKILDNIGNALNQYPVIPKVKSRNCYKKGSIVTVVFTGGELKPEIVGG